MDILRVMDACTGLDLQYLLLGNDDMWWRNACVVANSVFAVRAYTRVTISQFACWDADGSPGGVQCISCTRPRRLYAKIHHTSTAFCKRWNSRCAVCEWKVSNREAALLVAHRLWPPLLDSSLWGQVLQFLCLEGSEVAAKQRGTDVLLRSPHLRCVRETAVRRAWHSVLLTGFARADTILWHCPWLTNGIYTSGRHTQVGCERAAWAALALLCGNPLWLLVASCGPASARTRFPSSGRPIQILLAFLGGGGCLADSTFVSLWDGCRARTLM